MSSYPHRGLRRLSILLCLPLLAAGCVSGPRISVNRAALPCSKLIPAQLRADVEGADLPPENATVGDVYVALDQQTGKLDTANSYKRAAIEIVEACEQRDREVDAQLTKRKRVLGVF